MERSQYKLYDTHCHLQASVFGKNGDVVERALQVGVSRFVCCATDPEDWAAVIALSQAHPEICPALGVHPWYLPPSAPEVWLPQLERALEQSPHAWVGEIGVDRTAGPPLEDQEKAFVPQLELAGRLKRPASLHCRRTWDRLALFLRQRKNKDIPVVLHSFSGSIPVAKQLLDVNAYFSFSGALTRTRNQRLPEVLRFLPKDRVLIETDSPDLLPQALWRDDPHRPNEPSFIVETFRAVCSIWNLDAEQVAAILEKNSLNLLDGAGFSGKSLLR